MPIVGTARAHTGSAYSSLEGKWGFIDNTGKLQIPVMDADWTDGYYSFENGLIKVRNGNHWSMYDTIFTTMPALMVYSYLRMESSSREIIEPFIVDRTQPLRYMVNYQPESGSEYATHPHLVDYEVDIYHGVLDTRMGRVVIPAIYDSGVIGTGKRRVCDF